MEARIRSLANRAARSGTKATDSAAVASGTSIGSPTAQQPSESEKEALIQTLVHNVKGKRDFEAVFQKDDGVAGFARAHQLTANQVILLEAMRYQKDVYRPNAVLDGIMTIGFAVTCAVMAKILWAQDLLTAFCLGLLLTHAVVHRIREIGAAAAMWIGGFAVRAGLVDTNPFLTPLQMKKWQDQFWQLAIHVVTSALEWHILSTEPWWYDPKTCWMPSCEEQKKGPVRLDLKLLYISQLAIWTYTCIAHRFFDERRRDYFILYGHHLVTIALVLASWYGGSMRIGLLVLYVHDISDIFVDALKMVNLTKLEGKRGFFLSEIAYVSCIVAWLYYRMWQYPFRVMKGAGPDALSVLGPPAPYSPDGTFWGMLTHNSLGDWASYISRVHNEIGIAFYVPGHVLLFTLLCLHFYWFYLLAMVGYRILTESAREASRQEYEGDSEPEDEDSGKTGSSASSAAGRKQLAGSSSAAGDSKKAAKKKD